MWCNGNANTYFENLVKPVYANSIHESAVKKMLLPETLFFEGLTS
jgi:hypothetical protein